MRVFLSPGVPMPAPLGTSLTVVPVSHQDVLCAESIRQTPAHKFSTHWRSFRNGAMSPAPARKPRAASAGPPSHPLGVTSPSQLGGMWTVCVIWNDVSSSRVPPCAPWAKGTALGGFYSRRSTLAPRAATLRPPRPTDERSNVRRPHRGPPRQDRCRHQHLVPARRRGVPL